MRNSRFVLFAMVLLAGVASCAQDFTKTLHSMQSEQLQPTAAGTSSCSQQPLSVRVPLPLLKRAKVKARLLSLLRASLFDDAKGVVNVAQEKEIRKLANELRKQDQPPY